jgi:hypothetical protein
MSNPLPPPANATPSTLVNDLRFQVKYAKNGLEEMITVKELAVTDLYQFLEHMSQGKTPALVGLCTGRNRAWVDSLELRSFTQLAQKCVKVNFQRAMVIAEETVAGMTAAPLLLKLGQTLGLTASLIPASESLQATRKSPEKSSHDGEAGADRSPEPAASESAAAIGTAASG